MRSIKGTQSGFGIVEILAVAATVVVLSVAGILVYRHQHKNTVSSTSTASQTSSTPTTSANTQPVQPAPTATQYVTITEWGVKAPYLGTLKLSYTLSPDGKTATFSSDQLSALSSECVGRGGFIVRWASTDKVSAGSADANTPTATTYFASASPSTYGHVGNYYYMFQHDMAACGDPSTTSTLYSQTNDAVKALVPKLQASTN